MKRIIGWVSISLGILTILLLVFNIVGQQHEKAIAIAQYNAAEKALEPYCVEGEYYDLVMALEENAPMEQITALFDEDTIADAKYYTQQRQGTTLARPFYKMEVYLDGTGKFYSYPYYVSTRHFDITVRQAWNKPLLILFVVPVVMIAYGIWELTRRRSAKEVS